MENSVEHIKVDKKNNDIKNEKKYTVKMKNGESIIENLVSFWKKNICKTEVIVTIIAVVIYTISFFGNYYQVKAGKVLIEDGTTYKTLFQLIKHDVLLSFILIFAGITPYCFLSLIGILEGFSISDTYLTRYALGMNYIFTSYIGGLIQVIGFSLAIAVGMYYCRLSTKKRKYYNYSSFGMEDLKEGFYELRKDKKKLEEIKNKKIEKAKKIQESNVKIPYFQFLLLGLISFAVEVVGTLIAVI